MSSKTLLVSDPSLVAEFVRQSEFQGILEKRFAVPEDYLAILFRNGKIVDAYKGAHFSVGGLVNSLKGIIGGSTSIGMLIADLKPFQVSQTFRALSQDKVEIVGVAAIELQLDPEQPQNILGMMSGRRSLSRADILARIRPHLSDRILEAVLARHGALEIRGNTGLQDKIQADIMKEVERVVGGLGIIVNAVSMEWAVNEVERSAMDSAAADRAEAEREVAIKRALREAERVKDATEFAIRTDIDQKKFALVKEQELAQLILNKEVEFVDLREAHQRRQELEVIEHEVKTLQAEREARFENELAEAQQIQDLTQRKLAIKKIELEIEKMERLSRLDLEKIEALTRIEINQASQASAAQNIATLAGIEQQQDEQRSNLREKEKQAQHERDIIATKVGNQAEYDLLALKGKMTPEQLLAQQAGLSPGVAAVLVEQAKAQSSSKDEVMHMMRELVDAAKEARVSSEQQAKAMFQMGMDGAVGIAFGAGGKSAAPATAAEAAGRTPAAAVDIDCPKCGRTNAPKARFCAGCGHQLRT
ncbi:MAG: hypothetical protein QM773_21600 [Hyphomonadaceae bacterium]